MPMMIAIIQVLPIIMTITQGSAITEMKVSMIPMIMTGIMLMMTENMQKMPIGSKMKIFRKHLAVTMNMLTDI